MFVLSVHLRLKRMREPFAPLCPPPIHGFTSDPSLIDRIFFKVFCPFLFNSRLKTRTEDYCFTFGYFLRSSYCNPISRECCNVHFRPDTRYQYSDYAQWIKIGKTVSFVLDSKDFFHYYTYKSCYAVSCAVGHRPLYFLQPNVISVVHVSGSQHWIDIVMSSFASSSSCINMLISLCSITDALY